jgi:anti-sigma-K factor RskA
MDGTEIHELSAAYALHALDAAELEAYEEHLARCLECRENVASFQAAAAELAYDTESPAPAAVLRNRILTQAASERPTVAPPPTPRRRWALPVAAAAAVAAGAVALGLSFWAADLSRQVDDLRAQQHGAEEVAIMLANPDAERIPIEGGDGALIVDPDSGVGHLLLFGLDEAPEAHTYEAWVVEDGRAVAAGLFSGGGDRATVVQLSEPVPPGAVVAVTVEVDGGVDQSEQQPIITSDPAA